MSSASVETRFKLACRLYNQGYAFHYNYLSLLKGNIDERLGKFLLDLDKLNLIVCDTLFENHEAIKLLTESIHEFQSIQLTTRRSVKANSIGAN